MPTERQKSTCAAMMKVAMEFGALDAEPPFLASAEDIDVPTLILAGTRSPNPIRCVSRIINDKLKRARHRTIANAGHMLPITHPAAVAEHLKDHFAKRYPENANRKILADEAMAAFDAFDLERLEHESVPLSKNMRKSGTQKTSN